MSQLNINLFGIICDYVGFNKEIDFEIEFYEKKYKQNQFN
jgi:hypothetical protein